MVSIIASLDSCIVGLALRADGDIDVTCPLHGEDVLVSPQELFKFSPIILSSVN